MTQRDTSGDAAEATIAGRRAFRDGISFHLTPPMARDPEAWRAGWLSGAEEARIAAQGHATSLTASPEIHAALAECSQALRYVDGVSKIGPGHRSRLNSAARKVEVALAALDRTGVRTPRADTG